MMEDTLLHSVAFFHVASLLTTGQKIGGAQLKSSRAGQQNIFFIFQPDFNMQQNILLYSGMIMPNILVYTQFFVA